MNRPAPAPSKILADLEQYQLNWKPTSIADHTLVVPTMRPFERILTPADVGTKILRKGDSGEAVSELRIRLAGFGGVLPGTAFDENLVQAVKQFEKDVMSRTESGDVDEAFAVRLDQFAKDWPINFEKQLKCPCGKCEGYGKGQFKGEYTAKYAKSKNEAGHKYEYPGIHRSVLWASRALMYYATLDQKNKIKFNMFSSGYRCHIRNQQKGRPTTNHMGKALDMNFSYNAGKSWVFNRLSDVEAMREIAKNRLAAKMGWASPNHFSMESAAQGAKTWVHIDVRAWAEKYRADVYFCKDTIGLDGTEMVTLLARSNGKTRIDPNKSQIFNPKMPAE